MEKRDDNTRLPYLFPKKPYCRSRKNSSNLFKNFPQFVVIHTVKAFVVVNKAEVDVSLELSCFFDDTKVVGNLISGSSAFSKTNFNILKFMVHILLKTGLENFEHYVRRVQLCSSLSILWLCLSLGLE